MEKGTNARDIMLDEINFIKTSRMENFHQQQEIPVFNLLDSANHYSLSVYQRDVKTDFFCDTLKTRKHIRHFDS